VTASSPPALPARDAYRDRIVHGLGPVTPSASAVCIGFFDGVHRGHQAMIATAVRRARELGVRSVAVTFDRHPQEVVKPGSQPPLLLTHARRAQLVAAQGVDLVVVLPFDDDLRHQPPEEFVDHVLVDPLQARAVIVGDNFRYGHKAAGDVHSLTAAGPSRGFTVDDVPLVEVGGTVVSSTEIRGAVVAGDVERARQLLGRPHFVDGVVVRGDQRGRGLGFPTANLQVDPRIAVPAKGVYAGVFHGPDGPHPAVISVGTNPTFGGSELRVEAHLLDHEADLYGVSAAIDFRHHLREEHTYPSAAALVVQMEQDRAQARSLLGV
jgi:riboflavin kinase / FMN adenylyltransferase